MLSRSAAAASLAVAVLAAPLAAQADTARLSRVVVTATRSPLAQVRVPASVTVLDGAELRAQGITHVGDALRQVPGVAMVQAGSFGAQTSLFVRGGQNNYTKVLLDGIPLNEPGGAIDLGTLTLDDVERIEVLRGPASVLYGSDAVTGVVHIITRRGAGRPSGSLDVRGGTHESYDATASLQAGTARVRGSAGAARHASAGIYRFNSDYRNSVLHAGLQAAPWSAGELRVTARYSDVRAEYPTDFTGAPVDTNAFRTEKRMVLGAELGRRVGPADLRFQYNSNMTDAVIDDARDAPAGTSDRTLTHLRRQGAELRSGFDLSRLGTLTTGASVEWQAQGSEFSSLAASGAGFAGNSWTERRSTALFAQLLRTRRVLTTSLGARLDDSKVYGSFGTWRASLNAEPWRATRFRASAGTAFREPSFAESTPSAFSIGNPDLRPERTTSFELGAERGFRGERVVLGATYFNQRFVDLIDYRFDPAGSRYENIARARANGVEAEVRGALGAGVSADASFTYVDTRVLARGFSTSPLASLRAGGRLLRRPMHSGSAGLSYRGARGAQLGVRATLVGAREDRRFSNEAPFTEAVMLSPYDKVDLSAELPVLARRAAVLTLRVDNLLDREYQHVAGYAAPGRLVFGGLRLAF